MRFPSGLIVMALLVLPTSALAAPTLPAARVAGGFVLGDSSEPTKRHAFATGVKGVETFRAIVTRHKLILDFGLTWDWEAPEKAAKTAAGKDGDANRLPWSAATQAALVLKRKDGELVCALSDVTLTPIALSLGGSLEDAKTAHAIYETLQDANTPAVLRVCVARQVATPAVDLRLKIDRQKVTDQLERKVAALGGRASSTQLTEFSRELITTKIVTYTFGDGKAVDPEAEAWLTELATARLAAMLAAQALKREKPPEDKKANPVAFAWDESAAKRFVTAKFEITGVYSTTLEFRQVLTFPVKALKIADHKGDFLDLREK